MPILLTDSSLKWTLGASLQSFSNNLTPFTMVSVPKVYVLERIDSLFLLSTLNSVRDMDARRYEIYLLVFNLDI